jgi:hypothetical protein
VRQQQQVDRGAREQRVGRAAPARGELRPPRAGAARQLDVDVRHRVAAHHHRDLAPRRDGERVGDGAVPHRAEGVGEVVVRAHRGVPVVAHDPQVRALPVAGALRVRPQLGGRVVDDAERVAHDGRVVAARVRRLVDAGERGEHHARPVRGAARPRLAHARGDLGADVAVDVEPPRDVAGEVGARGAERERGAAPEPRPRGEPAADHVERGEPRGGELEQRGRRGVEVAVDVAHLGADVAARVVGERRARARAVEPAEPRQPDGGGEAPHQEGRVRRPGDRREGRRHRVQRPLGAEARQGGERAAVERRREGIGTGAVGD